MPHPHENEPEDKFVARCIPVILEEGTAENATQAAAICHALYQRHNEEK